VVPGLLQPESSHLLAIPKRYTMTIRKRFAMRLKQLRQQRELTQAALAKKMKFSVGYMARLEQGLHDPPLSTVEKLAKALKIEVGELVA
jgi:transcriptional regulator with XRE-family HTH domain